MSNKLRSNDLLNELVSFEELFQSNPQENLLFNDPAWQTAKASYLALVPSSLIYPPQIYPPAQTRQARVENESHMQPATQIHHIHLPCLVGVAVD